MSWDGIDEIVAIADNGTFAAAAQSLGVSTSHVSRAVAQLENRIGAQIFVRTTRRVVATPTGRVLIEQFRRMITERDDAIAAVSDGGEPRGEVRVTCSIALGERFVAPIAREFAFSYPQLSVSIELTNRVVDLVAESFDLAIRTGHMPDSRLVATRIASRRFRLCAAPSYLDRHGAPATLQDLDRHECLIGTGTTWHFQVDGQESLYRPRGRWQCNSGDAVARAALEGYGICQLPEFYVHAAIERGELIALLDTYRAEDEPIWAVYPQRRHLLPKIRLLVDKLKRELPAALARASEDQRLPPFTAGDS